MNVLQILPELNVGGVETGTLDLSRHLVKLGHKAVVVSNGGRLVPDLQACGATHYQLPVHKKSIFSIMQMVPRLVEIIKKEEIDIVHARSRVPAWIAYFACRKTGKVYISTCHGYYRKHPFTYVMGWAKRVIVLSNVIARHMIDDFGVPHERIRLIARSVDLSKFKYACPEDKKSETFNIGIIGRITTIKGHLYFMKAMARVAREIPRIKIWIVGDAPGSKLAYKEQLQLLTKRLGLWNATEFLGVKKDIAGVLSGLDVLVLATTTHEAFGRVIIEAQASGVPVVATRVGGVVDIIEDGKNGLLVPPADPQAIAEAVVRLCRNPQLRRSLCEQAYKKVKEKYTVEVMVENTIAVYKEALSHFKILIVKFSSLGDVILTTAALRALRKKFPAPYTISYLVGEASKEVLWRCPYLDEVLVYDFKGKDAGLAGLLRMSAFLKKKNFDLLVDFQNNRRSHLLGALAGIPRRYGYNNKKFGSLLTRSVRDSKPAMEPVAHQFEMLGLLGVTLEDPRLELWPSPQDERYIDDFLASQWLSPHQKMIGMNIQASARWRSKNWPLANMVKFCEELGRLDMRLVITGTQKDLAAAQLLINSAKDAKIINACAKTSVGQLASLIRRCAVYVSCDSASLHIAAAMGVPFVALFGPTDSGRHLPPAKRSAVVQKTLRCRPCYKPECKQVKCMSSITAEEVLEAVNSLLEREI